MSATISHLSPLPLTRSLVYAAALLQPKEQKADPVEKKGDKTCFNAWFTLFNAGFLLLLFLLLPFLAMTKPAPAIRQNPYEEQVLLEDNLFFLKTMDGIVRSKK